MPHSDDRHTADAEPTPAGTDDPVAAAVAQVCGGLAHDFSNLLTVLRGNLHLMSIDDGVAANQELVELIAAARSAADEAALRTRCLSLISGAAIANPRTIDLNALLRRQAARFGAFLGRRIRIDLDLAEDLPFVAIDATNLEAALQALAFNAREAIAGEGTLTLTTRPCADPDGTATPHVCLEIRDTGRGMTEEQCAAAASLLYTSRPRNKAAGLGLPAVRQAADSAGGSLRIASTPGQGTRVTLFLPAVGEPDAGAFGTGGRVE